MHSPQYIKIKAIALLYIGLATVFVSCGHFNTQKETSLKSVGDSLALKNQQPAKQKNMYKSQLRNHLVIAHRGTTYWAPEETEAAMRWARNVGADYLEFDLQRTKDGKLIALHDDKLLRTTDVATKFPDRKEEPVSTFTYEELLSLDAGSWFNLNSPKRAHPSFDGLDILTLEDVIQIAQGKKIKRDISGKRIMERNKDGVLSSVYETDPMDVGHRPGIYVETKVPSLFPGIERDLKHELMRLGWYHADHKLLKPIPVYDGKVNVASTPERVILQTFSKASLAQLQTVFERPLPTCFLIWRGTDKDDLPNDLPSTFEEWVIYGKKHGASIIGLSIGGAPNNYTDLLQPLHREIINKHHLLIHAYSFDTEEQIESYQSRVNGMFTNRADLSLTFYRRKDFRSSERELRHLGY